MEVTVEAIENEEKKKTFSGVALDCVSFPRSRDSKDSPSSSGLPFVDSWGGTFPSLFALCFDPCGDRTTRMSNMVDCGV